MSPWVGRLLLVASSLGFPLTQAAIRRLGRPGAVLVEGVATGLLARDAALIVVGTPRVLRPGPARLLYAEAAAAAAAAALCLPLLVDPYPSQRVSRARPSALEGLRQFAVGALFGLHTTRFRIYLGPDHGRRSVDGA